MTRPDPVKTLDTPPISLSLIWKTLASPRISLASLSCSAAAAVVGAAVAGGEGRRSGLGLRPSRLSLSLSPPFFSLDLSLSFSSGPDLAPTETSTAASSAGGEGRRLVAGSWRSSRDHRSCRGRRRGSPLRADRRRRFSGWRAAEAAEAAEAAVAVAGQPPETEGRSQGRLCCPGPSSLSRRGLVPRRRVDSLPLLTRYVSFRCFV